MMLGLKLVEVLIHLGRLLLLEPSSWPSGKTVLICLSWLIWWLAIL